jgi:hypothetical protein
MDAKMSAKVTDGGRMASLVSTRGQITIDRSARNALAVKPGMVAVQLVVDGHLEVHFIPGPHRRSLFGILPPREPTTATSWEAIEDRAALAIATES